MAGLEAINRSNQLVIGALANRFGEGGELVITPQDMKAIEGSSCDVQQHDNCLVIRMVWP